MGGWQHRGTQTAWRRLAFLRARAMHCAPLPWPPLLSHLRRRAPGIRIAFFLPPPSAGLGWVFLAIFPTPRRISRPPLCLSDEMHIRASSSRQRPRLHVKQARASCTRTPHLACLSACWTPQTKFHRASVKNIPYAEATTLWTMPESLQARVTIDDQATV
ncbi:uncharacterized protein PSANT_06773 [Moesziomyces antarcticus]|uniref:Uncharacterized protein n=1 Tax=Pseudozyma antarctica TaxID=84753 RepID=A0A5C3FXQ7_PSEA2|nr:uncharacterized protein PSANT_06773 [Moesziomyces antarcticus]